MTNGRFVEADPNTSRLFFAPTGRTLANIAAGGIVVSW